MNVLGIPVDRIACSVCGGQAEHFAVTGTKKHWANYRKKIIKVEISFFCIECSGKIKKIKEKIGSIE